MEHIENKRQFLFFLLSYLKTSSEITTSDISTNLISEIHSHCLTNLKRVSLMLMNLGLHS